jgi:hypothetical protein
LTPILPEAYAALAREKRQEQTFSEALKAHLGRRTTGADPEKAVIDVGGLGQMSVDLFAVQLAISSSQEGAAIHPDWPWGVLGVNFWLEPS